MYDNAAPKASEPKSCQANSTRRAMRQETAVESAPPLRLTTKPCERLFRIESNRPKETARANSSSLRKGLASQGEPCGGAASISAARQENSQRTSSGFSLPKVGRKLTNRAAFSRVV